MNSAILSIKYRNLYGNVATGCCLVALGVLKIIALSGPIRLGCAVFLLVLSGINLRACLSRVREREDEMSVYNSGRAAALALWATLIAIGITCVLGMMLNLSVDLSAISCLFIGFALTVYGISFALLERGE